MYKLLIILISPYLILSVKLSLVRLLALSDN